MFIIIFLYEIFNHKKKKIVDYNNNLSIHFYIKILICFIILLFEFIILIIEKNLSKNIEKIIEFISLIFFIVCLILKKNYKKNFLYLNLYFLYMFLDSLKNIFIIFVVKNEYKNLKEENKIIFLFILYLFKILIFFYNLIFKSNLKKFSYDNDYNENSLLNRLLSNDFEEKYKIFKIDVDNDDYFLVFIISINIDQIYFEIKINKKKYYFEKNFEEFLNFNKSNFDEINNNKNIDINIKKLIDEAYNLSVEINNKIIKKDYYYLENKENIFENILKELSKNNLIYLYKFLSFLNIKCNLMKILENKYKNLKIFEYNDINNNNNSNNNKNTNYINNNVNITNNNSNNNNNKQNNNNNSNDNNISNNINNNNQNNNNNNNDNSDIEKNLDRNKNNYNINILENNIDTIN